METITVEDLENVTVTVQKLAKQPGIRIVKYSDRGKTETEYPSEFFRRVVFSRVNNSKIFILTKSIAILFERCHNLSITIRTRIISNVQYYLCENINVTEEETPINYVEDSVSVNFFQDSSPHLYLVRSSHSTQVFASGSLGSPASLETETRRDISNMFSESKIFIVSKDVYEKGIWNDPFRPRPEDDSSSSRPIPIPRSGRGIRE